MSRPHGLKGGLIQQRAERNADYFGLDEEMLRAMGWLICVWTNLPDLENGNRGSHIARRPGLLPAHRWLVTDRFAAEARKTKRHRLGCLERSAQPP
jgi:hypothetical protein